MMDKCHQEDERPDPVPELTDAEKACIKKINETMTDEQALADLKTHLEIALTVELATIPIYLYTYYSINRTPHIEKSATLTADRAKELNLYANQAGGVIMSVAVEEMLHMSLACNMLYALGGDPEVYMRSPGPPNPPNHHYPVNLPHHATNGPDLKPMEIPLAKLSYEQFWRFLEIEWPEIPGSPPEPDNFETIGQVYSYVRCLVHSDRVHDKDFHNSTENQIQPEYYSPNNIDTVYAKKPFESSLPPHPKKRDGDQKSAAEVAEFPNEGDSHAGPDELLLIDSKLRAQQAIATICDQGEGSSDHHHISTTDDESGEEETHYWKFVTLQSKLEPIGTQMPIRGPKPPKCDDPFTVDEQAMFIANLPDNPITRADGHPGGNPYTDPVHQAISDACNGLYQYMLILTETTYKVTGIEQKKLFNKGMHMSMIWILDKLIQKMRDIPLDPNNKKGEVLAPTFENYDLGTRAESFANLNGLVAAAAKAAGDDTTYKSVMDYLNMIPQLPDVTPFWTNY